MVVMSSVGPRRISRLLVLTVAVVIVTALAGLLVSALSTEPLYAFIGLLTAALLIVLVLAVERTAIVSRNAAAKTERQAQAAVRDLAEAVTSVERRTKRMERVLNDTAGSVGRSSPIVRRIDASVLALASGGSAEGSTRTESAATSAMVSGTAVPGLQAQAISFPDVPETKGTPTFAGLTVLMIADEFTLRAFAHEWTVVTATPDNWREVIEAEKPDLVFTESAWEGNGGTWRYHLVGVTAPRPAIVELTTYCRVNGIPTVFWNKEDPPHFEDFLDTARLFDHVFTTDGEKIPDYVDRLGHDRVHLLPFAAQPAIHNPGRIRGVERDRAVVFGGMYFRDKYPERRDQLNILLPAAKKLGLDIFCRNTKEPRYQFPDRFAESVRPGIPYPQMISAYHGFKVVINVNSVTTSDTMCARRVFEATACGAAVVTTPTPAITHFFDDDLLTLVVDETSAFDRMRTLVASDELRERRVHLAQRRIWENDTYTHRALDVMAALGIEAQAPSAHCSIVVCTNRPDNLPLIIGNCLRQNIAGAIDDLELIIVSHGFSIDPELLESLIDEHRAGASNTADSVSVTTLAAEAEATLGEILNRGFDAARGDFLFRMDDDDFYGANYVRDQLNAIRFSGADLVGKAETYMYFEDEDATYLTFPGKAHRDTDFVRGATFAGPRETFATYRFKEQRTGEDSDFITRLRQGGGRIYSSDRFNYVVNRQADKTRHTWAATDTNLMGTGVLKHIGNDPRQIEL